MVAGSAALAAARAARHGVLAVLLVVTWACYAGAVVLLAPAPAWSLLAPAAGSFALSYAVGVAVVVAPAGVGAREVTLVAVLAPSIGVRPGRRPSPSSPGSCTPRRPGPGPGDLAAGAPTPGRTATDP